MHTSRACIAAHTRMPSPLRAVHTCTRRSFDARAYGAQILQQRQERFSTVYAALFVTLEQQQEQLLAVAFSTGVIK